MILRKKALSRRTLLQSGAAAIALPFLDAMIPAATAHAKTIAAPVSRIGYIYLPMGADMANWTPKGQTLDKLPSILTPLESVKHKLSVISGLEVRNAYPGTHATANSSFLSCHLSWPWIKCKPLGNAITAMPVPTKTIYPGRHRPHRFLQKLIPE